MSSRCWMTTMSSADTTVSAYDMLSNEDREALDWVRDHGGLDALRSEMPVISYRASLVGSVYDALDIDPDEPGAAMMLASEVKRLRDDHDALLWMDERGGARAAVPRWSREAAEKGRPRRRPRLREHGGCWQRQLDHVMVGIQGGEGGQDGRRPHVGLRGPARTPR